MTRRKICVVSGSRAEYGLILPVMREIAAAADLQLQLVVTGTHLCPEFGLTHRVIEVDGFHIDEKVEMIVSSDTGVGLAKSIGLGVAGLADAFQRLQPDWVLVPGDRFEVFAAAQAATVLKIPLIHLFGGDTTEGAFDEAFRHSITKMAHLHFVTNEPAWKRVRQLGESPDRIFNLGSPGIDTLQQVRWRTREELEAELGIHFGQPNLLVTFHPITLDRGSSLVQLEALLEALEALNGEASILFTKSNADSEGRALGLRMEAFASERPNVWVFTSLGQERYLSLMRQVDVVVGNSSSGLYEAPSLKKPTVNIGDRQKGRVRADSVLDCRADREEILKAIRRAVDMDCGKVVNPYGQGGSAAAIVREIRKAPKPETFLMKSFAALSECQ